ncbi:alpha/beta hydrolase family esterase [Corynebacterium pacaense]|uniref:alpha/beta hydrolase family esterase n=1 Tax=Corynebacterium pacaense TaxID=1816684 RepID=UPI0015C46511|nr:polyhydroxybutyrate depolymerase [Corynebacterium pacaense]
MFQGSLHHQGRERTFTVVETDAPSPDLCVFFHGSRQTGTVARKFTNFTFDTLSTRGCVVCYVDGVDRHFNDARLGLSESTRELGVDDVGFFTALLRLMHERYGISRVFVVGYSNGGQMVMRLMHEVPKLLDGAATIAANFPTRGNTLPSVLNRKPHPVSYLAMAGTADPFSPYSGGDSGISASVRRGHGLSAPDSAAYFARRNQLDDAPLRTRYATNVVVDRWRGAAPVELWTLIGVGHLVPSGRDYPPFLGPSTDQLVAAEVIGDFFGLLPRGDSDQPA